MSIEDIHQFDTWYCPECRDTTRVILKGNGRGNDESNPLNNNSYEFEFTKEKQDDTEMDSFRDSIIGSPEISSDSNYSDGEVRCSDSKVGVIDEESIESSEQSSSLSHSHASKVSSPLSSS